MSDQPEYCEAATEGPWLWISPDGVHVLRAENATAWDAGLRSLADNPYAQPRTAPVAANGAAQVQPDPHDAGDAL